MAVKEIEETEVAKMMEYPSRLQMSMLAPVKAIAASIPEGDKEVRVVGYIFGEARGVSYRNNPNSTDGEMSAALTGAFEGVPSYEEYPGMPPELASEKRATLGSGVCFLPQQLQAVVVSKIDVNGEGRPRETPKRGQRVDVLGVTVPISVEIGIRKSASPVGYEWVTRGMMKVKAMSPLERMREAMGLEVGADLRLAVRSGEIELDDSDDTRKPKRLAAPKKAKKSSKR